MSRMFLGACMIALSSGFVRSGAAADDTPALVVVVSVDQFAYEYLERFRAGFDRQGIVRRVQQEGAWFTNCHHRHAVTTTAPGHSVQLTGAYPETSGIIDNDWFDRATGKALYCVADPQAKIVGPAAGDAPVSPKALLVDTLGDRLKMISAGRSKVFGVGIKDRTAILMAGHAADGAFWMSENGQWITSDYYRKDLPQYLRNINGSDAISEYAGKTWNLLYERSRYRHPPEEDSFGEKPPSGATPNFPHVLPAAGTKSYVRQMAVSPFGSELTLRVARVVLTDEQLGRDAFPDLLTINLSSNDYVGHAYGPESLEVEDMTYRTDQMLGKFVDFVNDFLEGRHWVFVLTADHGVAPIPERASRMKLDATRNPFGKDQPGTRIEDVRPMLEAHLKRALRVDASAESLVLAVIENQVYLREDHQALQGDQWILAQRLTRDWLLSRKGVAVAVTREQLLSGGATGPIESAIRRSFHPRRSGDVFFVFEPYDILGGAAATHGSPWEFDTHVPLLAVSFGKASPEQRVSPGRFHRKVSPACIAPTLAALLHIPPPGGCVEDPLVEALPSPASKTNPSAASVGK